MVVNSSTGSMQLSWLLFMEANRFLPIHTSNHQFMVNSCNLLNPDMLSISANKLTYISPAL